MTALVCYYNEESKDFRNIKLVYWFVQMTQKLISCSVILNCFILYNYETSFQQYVAQ